MASFNSWFLLVFSFGIWRLHVFIEGVWVSCKQELRCLCCCTSWNWGPTALYSSYTLRKWHGESGIIQWNPFWGNQTMRLYGKFEGFPLNGKFFGLIIMTKWWMSQGSFPLCRFRKRLIWFSSNFFMRCGSRETVLWSGPIFNMGICHGYAAFAKVWGASCRRKTTTLLRSLGC